MESRPALTSHLKLHTHIHTHTHTRRVRNPYGMFTCYKSIPGLPVCDEYGRKRG